MRNFLIILFCLPILCLGDNYLFQKDLSNTIIATKNPTNTLGLQVNPNAYNRYFLDAMVSEDNLNPLIPNDNIRIEAYKGDIVIFPADIFHSVMSHDKDEDRVCISMNISFARLVDPDDYVSKPLVLK